MIAIDHLTERYRNFTVVDGYQRGPHPGHRGRRPRRRHSRVADRRLAGRAAPGRDLTHPPSGGAPHRGPPLATPAEPTLRNHRQRTAPPLPRLRRDNMRPMFKELFIDTDTDADALAADDDRRCRARRPRPNPGHT